MININARSVIYSARNLLMPQQQSNSIRGGEYPIRTERGLLFALDTNISHRDSHKNGKEARGFIYVLVCGHSTAFVSYRPYNELDKWENVSNHDSCWIDAIETELNSFYFRLCKLADDMVAPRDLDQRTWFSVFGHDMQFVEIKTTPDDERNKAHGSSYWKKIQSLRKIEIDEFCAYHKKEQE